MSTTAVRTYTARTLSVLDLVVVALVAFGVCWEVYRQMIRHEAPAPTSAIVALIASGLILSGLLTSASAWVDPTHPRHRPVEWVTLGVAGAMTTVAASAATGAGYMILAFDPPNSRHLAALIILTLTFLVARLLFGWIAARLGIMHSHDDEEITEAQRRRVIV